MRYSSIPIGRIIAKNIRKVGACSTCGLLDASIQKLSKWWFFPVIEIGMNFDRRLEYFYLSNWLDLDDHVGLGNLIV